MRAAALVPIGILVLLVALLPVASVVSLGAPALGALMTDSDLQDAARRSLSLGATGVAIGWPAGIFAAFGIWDGHRWLRRLVLGAGVLLVLLPPLGMSPAAIYPLGGHAAATRLAAHAGPATGMALLILAARLDRLDPRILRSAAACGATPWQAWRLVLWPALGWAPFLAAAAGFGLSVLEGRADMLPAPASRPTLAGLVDVALRRADVAAASETLILGGLAVAPMVLLGLVTLLRRVWRCSPDR